MENVHWPSALIVQIRIKIWKLADFFPHYKIAWNWMNEFLITIIDKNISGTDSPLPKKFSVECFSWLSKKNIANPNFPRNYSEQLVVDFVSMRSQRQHFHHKVLSEIQSKINLFLRSILDWRKLRMTWARDRWLQMIDVELELDPLPNRW